MNNTALRAEAQSANNTHMVFYNKKHENFYFEKLEQARCQDCYHKALIYILGISEDTRNHFNQIYDIKSGNINTECLHQGWQTSGSVQVMRLAFNLYTNGTPSVDDYNSRDEQSNECKPNPQDWVEYIRKRYFLLRLCGVLLAGHQAPLSGILSEIEVHHRNPCGNGEETC